MSAIDPRMRDTRPVPLVGIKAIERMFLRQIDTALPEGRLAVAVICQAMVDCAVSGPIERADAQGFLRGWRLDAWAGLVGLSPDFVRDVAIRTLYLAPAPITDPASGAKYWEKPTSRRSLKSPAPSFLPLCAASTNEASRLRRTRCA